MVISILSLVFLGGFAFINFVMNNYDIVPKTNVNYLINLLHIRTCRKTENG